MGMNIVGIETRYGLVDAGIEIRGGGGRFCAKFLTGSGGPPAYSRVGTGFRSRGKAVGVWR